MVVLVVKEDNEEEEEGEAEQQLGEEEGLQLWLLRDGGVLGFLQFLGQGGGTLVGWQCVVWQWKEILLLSLGLEWWRGAR